MPVPARYDVTFYEGDDWTLIFRLKDSTGAPEDLSAYTGKSQVRSAVDSQTVTLEFTVTISGNQITVHAPASLTNVPAGSYVYDVQLTGPSTRTPLAGKVKVLPQVTR